LNKKLPEIIKFIKKPFIWRVKDPMAALWPFLALVSEVNNKKKFHFKTRF
jgi:hypothetical protein